MIRNYRVRTEWRGDREEQISTYYGFNGLTLAYCQQIIAAHRGSQIGCQLEMRSAGGSWDEVHEEMAP